MKNSRYRLFNLHFNDNFQPLKASDAVRFNPVLYSRFKYGDGTISVQYATMLAELFESKKVLKKEEKYFLCGSAYQVAPTAATSIAEHLHSILLERGYQVTYFKINGRSFVDDYSSLSLIDRDQMLSSISISLDKATQQMLANKCVIVVDDIQITGLHQRAVKTLLEKHLVKKILFSYVAVLKDQGSKYYPQVEWDLNHYYVDNLAKLIDIIQADKFLPNARLCKFILAAQRAEVKALVPHIPTTTLGVILEMIKGDQYHKATRYHSNFLLIKQHFEQRQAAFPYAVNPSRIKLNPKISNTLTTT